MTSPVFAKTPPPSTPSASEVSTSTSDFNGTLSGTDTTIQKALDTLDDAVAKTASPSLTGDPTITDTTPTLTFNDSDNAAGTAGIYANSSGGANAVTLSLGVEDSTGESKSYLELNGGAKTVDVLKSLNIGSAGVRLTDNGDGGLTFLGLGNGYTEDLTLDFDNTSNTVSFSSSTGVTKLDFGSIGWSSSGSSTLTGTLTVGSGGSIALQSGSSLTGLASLDFGDGVLEVPNSASEELTLTTLGQIGVDDTDDAIGFHAGANGEIAGEVQISAIQHFAISFDPASVCAGAIDRLFLFTVKDDAPHGIIIDEWTLSFEADPTTELVKTNLKYADAFIGIPNSVSVDGLDTTAGYSAEDTDANINSGNAIPNGKVLYIDFETAYTEAGHQVIFEMWYHAEED